MRWEIIWFGHMCHKESPLRGTHILFTQLIQQIFILLYAGHLLTQGYGAN